MTDIVDLRHMIGQHLVAGFQGTFIPDAFRQAVHKSKLGNVILFSHNVESKEQLHRLCEDITALIVAETGIVPFITIDQEGGVVSRLPEDAGLVPGAMGIAAGGGMENAFEAGRITGQELSALGINFDLAPVADVNSNPNNPVIGVRSYGDTPTQVAAYACAMMRGLQAGGVLSCAKHFPGHGDTAVDSHVGLPCVSKSLEELLQCELIPFQALIEAGVPAVMSTHILFPQLEKDNLPATMSRTIMTGLLRERLGFRGLILSDCMQMGAIADHYGTVPGMVKALKAGVDMVFASHNADLAAECAQRYGEELQGGSASMEELQQSTERILQAKAALKKPTADMSCVGCKAHQDAVMRLYEQSITPVSFPMGALPALGEAPLFVGCPPFLTTQVSDDTPGIRFADFMAEKLGGTGVVTSVNPDEAAIADVVKVAQKASCIVACTYAGQRNRGQLALVKALAETDVPVICIALRNPYDLAEVSPKVTKLAAYSYTSGSLLALARVLSGEVEARGKLPVALSAEHAHA